MLEHSDEGPVRRTLKMMLTRPELVDHMACNHWKYRTGRQGTMETAAEWEALPDAERDQWIDSMWEAHHAFTVATPEEKAAMNAASWRRQLKINDGAARP
jgi:hypothetical protein